MPQERLSEQALLAKAMGEDQLDNLELWTNYIKDLGWNCLRFFPSEMMDVMEAREV